MLDGNDHAVASRLPYTVMVFGMYIWTIDTLHYRHQG